MPTGSGVSSLMAGTPTTNRLLEYRPSTSVRLELMPSSSTSAVISSGIVTTSPLRDASVAVSYTHLAVYLFRGELSLLAALPYLAGGLVGGWIGGKLYGRVSVKWLKWLFAGFLFYAGVKYLL